MSEKVQVENVELNPAIAKAKGFWAKFSKPIIIVGSIIILLGGGYFIYKYFFKLPKEQQANEAIFPAEKMFGKMAETSSFSADSVSIVLNGSKPNNITGLLSIISKYGGTASGNRAEYMAGACYLHLKQFDKAIKHLKAFDGNGASQVQSKAYLMLGHAYAEQKKTDDALSYYKKAASAAGDDDVFAAEALFIAGAYADSQGKTKDALSIFQDLKDKYESSNRVASGDVDRFLGKLGATK